MPLTDITNYFVQERKILASMCVCCGGNNWSMASSDGEKNEAGDIVDENTIYDLASLTKLFTGLLVTHLYETGELYPDSDITDIAPEFKNLKGITVDKIYGFEVPLVTSQRIDSQLSRETAQELLFNIEPSGITPRRIYSDMHSMVLKYVIEDVSGEKYMDLVKKIILEPLEMRCTFAHVPKDRLDDCCSYNNEYRIENGIWSVRRNIRKGIPHDPKAAILQGNTDDVPGHAGIFSTIGDMKKLCQGILQGKIVSVESIHRMAHNRTGKKLDDGTYTQFLGSQCYVRHPVQYFSEIPVYMSDNAIGLSGFTGNHISIDIDKQMFVVMLGNRVLNRLTVVVPQTAAAYAEIGLSSDGSGIIVTPDGEQIASSVNYVHYKDEHMHRQLEKIFELKQ